jgi:hypothetical protein
MERRLLTFAYDGLRISALFSLFRATYKHRRIVSPAAPENGTHFGRMAT